MNRLILSLLAGALVGLSAAASAQESSLSFGGDRFTAGQNASINQPVPNDAFLAGYTIALTAPVTGDAHLGGFDVTSAADVAGNLYAAGFSVSVSGKVGADLTAFGNTVTLKAPAPIPGNARLAGQTVTVSSPIGGSALITAQTLTLDGAVAGDLNFYGENIVFGPGARVDGALAIQAPKEILVPATVASADRVSFTQLVNPDYVGEAGKTAQNVVRSFWPAFWAAAVWWLLLLLVGTAFIALMPRGLAALQTVSEKRPFRNIGLGVLALASVIGLVPVFAFTLLGIVLIPFVLLFAAIIVSLAYLAGTYFAGLRLARAFTPVETNVRRLVVLAASLVAAVLLGLIPLFGWFISLLLVIFGFGVITVVLMVRWSAKDATRLQPPPAGAPATAKPVAA